MQTPHETTAPLPTAILAQARRIVIKVGTTLVTNEGKGLDDIAIGQWCRQIGTLLGDTKVQRELIVVSSGSIAEGMKRLGWSKRPSAINELQAAAAVGQMGLAQHYESHLRQNGVQSAQVLLTHADLMDRERYLNARSTLLTLLRHKVLPIINENDTVVNDEIKFGDNDTLGALVTNLVEADLLIILTDQKGLYTADPRKDPKASLIQHTQAGKPDLEKIAGGTGSKLGKGGMLTKVLAAKRAASSGASTVIAWGREDDVLVRICSGELIGSLLQAKTAKLQARKRWMANHLQLPGSVLVDAGAAQRLRSGKASLLPVGITSVKGLFSRGDVVTVCDANGLEIARGLVNYSSTEARKLCGQPSSAFMGLLGYSAEPEMIHRDNLVLSPNTDSDTPAA